MDIDNAYTRIWDCVDGCVEEDVKAVDAYFDDVGVDDSIESFEAWLRTNRPQDLASL